MIIVLKILPHRTPVSVVRKSGINAPTATTCTISAFDVLLTRMFYTPSAIPGPVSPLQKSSLLLMTLNNGSLNAGHGPISKSECELRRHGLFLHV